MRAPHLRPGAPLGPGPRGPWSQTKVPPFLERPARSGIGQAAQEGRPRGPWSRTKVLLVRDQEGPGPLGQCPACAGQGAVLPNARKPSKGTEEAWPPPRPVRSVAETSAFCLANPTKPQPRGVARSNVQERSAPVRPEKMQLQAAPENLYNSHRKIHTMQGRRSRPCSGSAVMSPCVNPVVAVQIERYE